MTWLIKIAQLRLLLPLPRNLGKRYIKSEVLIKSPEGGLRQDSVILLNQIRSIDKQILIRKLGTLSSVTLHKVDLAIQISPGLIQL